jgi:hypothetical protein
MRASPRSTSPRARCGRRCRCGMPSRAPALAGRERAQGTVSAGGLWRKERGGQSTASRCCRALYSCGRAGGGGGARSGAALRLLQEAHITMLMLGHGSPKTLRRAICCFHMAESRVNVDLVPIPALWGPSRKGWDFRPKAWQTLPLTQASLSALNHPRAVSDRGAPARCRPVPDASSALPNQPLSSLPQLPPRRPSSPPAPLSVSFCTHEVCGYICTGKVHLNKWV